MGSNLMLKPECIGYRWDYRQQFCIFNFISCIIHIYRVFSVVSIKNIKTLRIFAPSVVAVVMQTYIEPVIGGQPEVIGRWVINYFVCNSGTIAICL